MDAMDYSMDNAPRLPHPHITTGLRSCPYLAQQENMAALNGPMPPGRDAHIFNPGSSNSDTWYPPHSDSGLHRGPPSQMPNNHNLQPWSWSPPPYTAPHLPPLPLDFVPQSGLRPHYGGSGAPAPWPSTVNHEPLPFHYRPYASHPVNSQSPAASENGRGSQQPTSSNASQDLSQIPQPFPIPNPFNRRSTRPSGNSAHANTSNPSQRRTNDVTTDRGTRPPQMDTPEQQSSARARNSRNFSRNYSSHEPLHNRRRGWGFMDIDDEDLEFMDGHEWGQLGGFSGDGAFAADLDDEREMAILRGAAAAAKRVPPKSVIESFEKVEIADLSEEDRTCTICYNEFGVENPEGLNESPVRLPKCKHVFGDHCIKKWFEDQDTCPYCRDKLPSEPVRPKFGQGDRMRLYRMAGDRADRFWTQSYHHHHHHHNRQTSEDLAGRMNFINQVPEDYRFMANRNALEPWNVHIHNQQTRVSPTESPERRRTRGRSGNNRSFPSLSRPTSIGSARLITPATTQAPAQRPQLHGNATSLHMPRRSITPGLTRQGSATRPSGQTPSRLRHSTGNTSHEESSPAVAVGSGAIPAPAVTFQPALSSENTNASPSWPPEPFIPPLQASANTTQTWQTAAPPRAADTAQTRPSISAITNQVSEPATTIPRQLPDGDAGLLTGLTNALRRTAGGGQRPGWSR